MRTLLPVLLLSGASLAACGIGFEGADGAGGATSGQGGATTTSGNTGGGTAGTGGIGGTGGTGGIGAGGGEMGGGGGGPQCQSVFTWFFSSLDAWTELGADSEIVNDAAVISSGEEFGLIYTNDTFLLTSCGARVQVVDVSLASGSYTWFGATVSTAIGNRIEFAIVNGELQAFFIVNDASQKLHAAPYDFPAQSWLRMRNVAANVLFETAPNANGPWTTFHSAPAPAFIVNHVNFSLGVSNIGTEATATFDNFQVQTPN